MGGLIMKAALVSPNESVYTYTYGADKQKVPVYLGERIAEVTTQPFDIAPPLFWVSCADDVEADLWYYDKDAQQCVLIPPPPPPPPSASTTGTGGPNVVA